MDVPLIVTCRDPREGAGQVYDRELRFAGFGRGHPGRSQLYRCRGRELSRARGAVRFWTRPWNGRRAAV